MARVQLHIISRETIKPSSSTPPHLRSYKLSLLDQLTTPIYMPMVLFYPSEGCDSSPFKPADHRSRWLKNSLSETLSRYYPFAGRLTDGVSIDCNDEGVDFFEAQIECQLSEILKQPEAETLNVLFPGAFLWKDSSKGSLLGVQVSFFDCGGMAISVCISHKIADGCTISTFLNDWAAMARQSGEEVSPMFIATSTLPLNVPSIVPEIELEKRTCVTKRYLFDASRIADLKAMAADSGVQNPTRVEVVTALLYKCAMAVSNAKLGSLRQSNLIQLVNMRPRMVPPLPNNSVGNFSWYFTVSAWNEKEMKFHELVGQLRNGITQLCDKNTNNLKLDDWLLAILESTKEVKMLFDDLDVYRCSSFCRYPLYQVDYGWGKPVWVNMANGVVKNMFVLIDTQKRDGIEALVTLEEQDMAIFQCDEELLEFASMNPIA